MSEFHTASKQNFRLFSRPLWITTLLLLGVLVFAACQPVAPGADNQTATTEPVATETVMATEEMTGTEEMTSTEEMTGAEETTDTGVMTMTEGMTTTEEMTDTESMTASEEATGTAGMLQGDAAAGGYIMTLVGCGCHFNKDLGALAGGSEFETQSGVTYAANITSDPETGLGNWTDQQLVDVFRLGKDADGGQIHPVMPYQTTSLLADADLMNLIAALRALEPVVNEVPERELSEEPAPFTPATTPAAEAPTDSVERGAYLVALARCGGCHTPKDENGAPDNTRMLSGAPLQDTIAPNLTPAEGTGTSLMTEEEIATLLHDGVYDDGTPVEDPMAGVIKNKTSKLTDEDLLAIAAFLKSLPPVESEP